jgi:hypothetical protein
VTTVNTTQTLVNETTGCVASPRPQVLVAAVAPSYAAGRAIPATGLNGPIAGAAWLSVTRKSMTVPTFHDRRPLCST